MRWIRDDATRDPVWGPVVTTLTSLDDLRACFTYAANELRQEAWRSPQETGRYTYILTIGVTP
jgi:hypothetical protein